MARTIIADVRLAQGRPQAALDALPHADAHPRNAVLDDADAAIELCRHRAQALLKQDAEQGAIDSRARPTFDCREDRFGASCDVYAHDPALFDTRAVSKEARAAIDAHLLDSMTELQAAFIAQRAGDRELALKHFSHAEEQGKLPAVTEADTGYAALALHRPKEGAQYLEHAIDHSATGPGDEALSPLSLYDARAAHAEATRNWASA